MNAEDMSEQQALQDRLAYAFSDPGLLDRALTHDSLVSESQDNNEPLEFLGDRVLGLAIAELLLETFPEASEGKLAGLYNQMVRGETCAEVAEAIDLGKAMRMAPSEAQSGGRQRKSMLGDACEAVIAAIYLDGGFDPARQFVLHNWKHRMLGWRGPLRDAKTTLQEWTQSKNLGTPTYEVKDRTGPDHDPRFVIEVSVMTLENAIGSGRSKRDAEQAAATGLLDREKLWGEDANG